MATGTNNWNSLFKQVYGDGAIKAIPDFAKITKEVEFSQAERLGDSYVVPIVLQMEHGFSYGSSGDADFPLNLPVAGVAQKLSIKGNMIVLRSRLSYEDMFKATAAGAQAFESATALTVENMQRSFAKRLEVAFWYGNLGLAKVASVGSVSGGQVVATIDPAYWAPGLWSAMKTCPVDVWSTQATGATQRNTNGSAGGLTVYSVNMSNKTVTLASSNNTDLGAVAAGDFIYYYQSRTASAYKDCAGIHQILSNTGTMFGIDASQYELFKSNQRAIGGAISMLAVQNMVADCVNMGLMEDAKTYMATRRWNSLNIDQAALRRYGAYAKTAETGSEGIVYHSVNGRNEIEAHPLLWEGFVYTLPNPKKRLIRVGASNVTFRRPGSSENIFNELTDNAGLELRAFCDQAIALTLPAQACLGTGVTD